MDFLVIGAQKCATSWLFYCLREHPQLCLPEKKREPDYIGGATFRARGADWYFNLVGNREPGQLAGAVSVEYLFDANAAPEVARLLPNAKLLAVLREPLDRAISAYYWLIRKRLIEKAGLVPALEMGLRDVERGTQSPFAELLQRGLYGEQLNRYLQHFPAEALLIAAYEDIANDPARSLSSVYAYLGVDSAFIPPSFRRRPKANTYLSPLVALERLVPKSRMIAHASDFLNNAARRLGLGDVRPAIPATLHARLSDFFAEDLKSLHAIVTRAHAVSANTSNAIRTWTA
ncbi:MAG TPA: sulfotransferase [Gemmatimonadaceae bacterium]